MWSTAFGIITLAFVVFAIVYATLHVPHISNIDVIDQLYNVKLYLNQSLNSLNYTQNIEIFREYVNITRVRVVNITVSYNGSVVKYPLLFPLGHKVLGRERNVVYQLYVDIKWCRPTLLPSGTLAYLYEIKIRHSIDILPWLETKALVPISDSLFRHYYDVWKSTNKPPVLGLSPPPNTTYVRVAKALIYSTREDDVKLYVVAPSPVIYIIDYPLELPLACPNAFSQN